MPAPQLDRPYGDSWLRFHTASLLGWLQRSAVKRRRVSNLRYCLAKCNCSYRPCRSNGGADWIPVRELEADEVACVMSNWRELADSVWRPMYKAEWCEQTKAERARLFLAWEAWETVYSMATLPHPDPAALVAAIDRQMLLLHSTPTDGRTRALCSEVFLGCVEVGCLTREVQRREWRNVSTGMAFLHLVRLLEKRLEQTLRSALTPGGESMKHLCDRVSRSRAALGEACAACRRAPARGSGVLQQGSNDAVRTAWGLQQVTLCLQDACGALSSEPWTRVRRGLLHDVFDPGNERHRTAAARLVG
jgi:hypothetical protein